MVSLFVVLLFRTIKKVISIQPNVLTGRLKTDEEFPAVTSEPAAGPSAERAPSRAPAARGGSERALPAVLGRSEPEVSRRGCSASPRGWPELQPALRRNALVLFWKGNGLNSLRALRIPQSLDKPGNLGSTILSFSGSLSPFLSSLLG